ncbi:MAG: transcriptional repressor [Bacteroidales bacterium]
MKSKSYHLLKRSSLNVTKARERIVSYLLQFEEAVTGLQIENALKSCCDRSTIYRNLSAMSKVNLIHRIQLEGESRYKIHPGYLDSRLSINHPHFECQSCGRLYCMHSQRIDTSDLPKGFVFKSFNFIIYGICDKCNNKIKQPLKCNE